MWALNAHIFSQMKMRMGGSGSAGSSSQLLLYLGEGVEGRSSRTSFENEGTPSCSASIGLHYPGSQGWSRKCLGSHLAPPSHLDVPIPIRGAGGKHEENKTVF